MSLIKQEVAIMNMAQMKKLDKYAWLFVGIHSVLMLNVVVDFIFSM